MSRRRKVLVLSKEVTFQTTSETQPGSSRVTGFHQTMESLFLDLLVKKADFDPTAESIHGLIPEGFQNRKESEPCS